MSKKRLVALLMAFVMIFSLGGVNVFAAEKTTEEGKKIVATYLPCWGSRPWKVEDIDGNNLTHVYLSFARIDNGFQISDKEYRIKTEGGQYAMPDLISAEMIIEETWAKVAELQKKYPHLKFIIAVGGWEAEGFSDMAASEPTREIFVDSVVKYVEKHNLDGIDLDWEFPVNGGWGVIESRPNDKENFTKLVQLLRKELGEDKEISFCASVGGWFLDVIEWEKVVPFVDTVNIMAYDMNGTWSANAAHQSALYPNPKDPVVHWGLTGSEAVDRIIAKGVPADKILLGYPAYGKQMVGIKKGPDFDGLFQPFIVGADGNPLQEKTIWRGSNIPYNVLRDYYINKNGFTRYWDDASKVPYLFNGDTFITYDDEESLKYKAEYVKEKGLAGVMYWEYVNDVDGDLLKAVKTALDAPKPVVEVPVAPSPEVK